MLQLGNYSRSIVKRWPRQWLFDDGVSHMLFLVLLASIMYLWAPHKYSQRYAYSKVGERWDEEEAAIGQDSVGGQPVSRAGKTQEEKASAWALDEEKEGGDGGEEEESFMALTKGRGLTEDALKQHESAAGAGSAQPPPAAADAG